MFFITSYKWLTDLFIYFLFIPLWCRTANYTSSLGLLIFSTFKWHGPHRVKSWPNEEPQNIRRKINRQRVWKSWTEPEVGGRGGGALMYTLVRLKSNTNNVRATHFIRSSNTENEQFCQACSKTTTCRLRRKAACSTYQCFWVGLQLRISKRYSVERQQRQDSC